MPLRFAYTLSLQPKQPSSCVSPSQVDVQRSTLPRDRAAVGNTDIAIEEIFFRQSVLLERWHELAAEFKRRIEGMPFDLALELHDLLDESSV